MAVRAFLVVLVAALFGSVACGSGGPSPTPMSLVELRVFLARDSVTTLTAVSGQSVCPRQALSDNALHLTVTVPSDPVARDLYLYLFRLRDFERTGATMDACVADAVSTRPGATVSRLDVAPYRALGLDWSAELEEAVEGALHDAAPGG